jgi:short-subunit dehydrogenase
MFQEADMSATPVILVTGASSGIGAATARLFGQEGYRVVLAARRMDRMQSIVDELQSSGGQALAVAADLTRLDDIQRVAETALDQFGQVDVLFNNAGFGRMGWLESLDPIEDIQAQVEVNLLAVIQMTRAVLPSMITRRSGHVINMASMAGQVATPTYTIYAATKFAVRGFSEALRREVGIYNVSVSVIYPSGVATEFSQHARIRRKTGISTPSSLRLQSEDVARFVLSVARHPRRGLIIPWPMRIGAWINLAFPALTDWMIERNFTKPERLGDNR